MYIPSVEVIKALHWRACGFLTNYWTVKRKMEFKPREAASTCSREAIRGRRMLWRSPPADVAS